MKWILSIVLILGFWAGIASAQPDSLHVIWLREGREDSSGYGYSVLPMGDLNNDGFDDWGVYAHGADPGSVNGNPPYIEFFHGGNPPSTEPFLYMQLDSLLENIVGPVQILGDINGDGYKDWSMNVWRFQPTRMVAWIFLGGPSMSTLPSLEISLYNSGSIRPVGDFNGDSLDDMYLIRTHGGEIIYGSTTLDTVVGWRTERPVEPWFGVGDLNGDGFSDWINYWQGIPRRLLLYLGGTNPDTVPAYEWDPAGNHGFSFVPDINGDSFDDLIEGQTQGGVRIRYGSNPPDFIVDHIINFWCGANNGPGGGRPAGDINGDGYNDLILIQTGHCGGCVGGALALYLGHPWINPDPVWTLCGYWDYPMEETVIHNAQAIGDVNGDGIDDLILIGYDNTMNAQRGRVVIFEGDSTLHVPVTDPFILQPSSFSLSVYPNPFNSEATFAMTVPLGGGKIELEVVNVLGQTVYKESVYASGGELNYHFAARDFQGCPLATGIYVARLSCQGQVALQKLLLLR